MKFTCRLVFIAFLHILFFAPVFSQKNKNKPISGYWKNKTGFDLPKLSKAQILNDFNLMVKLYEHNHAGIYLYATPLELKKLATQIRKNTPDSASENQIIELWQPWFDIIGCGHTQSLHSDNFYYLSSTFIKGRRFGFTTVMVDSTLILIEPWTQDSTIIKGTKILAVNDFTVGELYRKNWREANSDGYNTTYRNKKAEQSLSFIYDIVPPRDSQLFTLELPNGEIKKRWVKIITIKPEKEKKEKYYQGFKTIYSKKNNYDFRVDSSGKIAWLQLYKFGKIPYFITYPKIFSYLKRKHIDHFILDFRNNGGGLVPHATYLVSVLIPEEKSSRWEAKKRWKIPKPFGLAPDIFSTVMGDLASIWLSGISFQDGKFTLTKYLGSENPYSGKVYCLLNGRSFSASTLVATYLKGRENCVILGEESGGGALENSAMTNPIIELPYTGLRISMPMYHVSFFGHLKSARGRGIRPDYLLKTNINSLLDDKDEWIEKCVKISKM
jgi:hypothetical protein